MAAGLFLSCERSEQVNLIEKRVNRVDNLEMDKLTPIRYKLTIVLTDSENRQSGYAQINHRIQTVCIPTNTHSA